MTDRNDPYRPRLADSYLGELIGHFAAVMVTGPSGHREDHDR